METPTIYELTEAEAAELAGLDGGKELPYLFYMNKTGAGAIEIHPGQEKNCITLKDTKAVLFFIRQLLDLCQEP